jgi:succinate dehydrogenase / fumarate reductase membrane anchor subunit
MVKSVLGVNHRGLTDWLVQRVSAVVMAVYIVGLVVFLALHGTHGAVRFSDWHTLFGYTSVKIATLLFVLAFLLHAWVGMWTVLTDYVKPFGLRFVLEVIIFLSLVTFFLAAWGIVWGIKP